MKPILVNFYSPRKENFTKPVRYSMDMANLHISVLFAANLKAAIERKYNGEVNQNQLARDSKVAQKSISNYLSALKKEKEDELDEISSPNIKIVAKLANALDVNPWELLHPDPVKAKREQDFYERIERDFKQLPPIDPGQERRVSERRTLRHLPPGDFGGKELDLGNSKDNKKTNKAVK